MKFNQYLTKLDRYNFLIDKVRVSFYVTYPFKYKDSQLAQGYIPRSSKPKKYELANGTVILSKKGIDTLIRYGFSFNCNTFLRKYLMSYFSISKTNGIYEFKNNVIPHELRLKAEEANLSVSKLRDVAYEELYSQIQETKAYLKKELKNIDISVDNFSTSLQYIEINYDIITHPDERLNKNHHIRQNLNNVCKQTIAGKYMSDKGETLLELNSIADVSDDTHPSRLTGCVLDKSSIKIYHKAHYPSASINRAERCFPKESIKLYSDNHSNVFNSKQDLIYIITKLGHISFNGFYPILGVSSHYSEEEEINIAKQYIKSHYDYLWEEAFEALLSGKYSIHTGVKGSASKKLAQKTIAIYRKAPDTLLKKKSRGVYTLNWIWILSKKV